MIITKLENALILDKPSGVATHTPDAGTTPGFIEMASQTLGIPLWAVHRLDKETSGALIAATTKESVEIWSNKLTEGRKKYVFISDHKSKDEIWSFKGRIEKLKPHVFALVDGEPNSSTKFILLGTCSLGYLYEAEISTGKTHQIRIHAKACGIPILGDDMYGGSNFYRLMLHSFKTQLDENWISSPIPKSFETISQEPHELTEFRVSLDRRRWLINYENSYTDCHRLVHREWEQDFCVEKLGSVLQILNYRSTPFPPNLCDDFLKLSGAKTWLQRQMKVQKQSIGEMTTHSEFSSPWIVTENKMKFELRGNQGQNSGLFLDQRINREKVKTISSQKRVANFFSYTGGFSVAAALGGASEVVSIDVSKATLDWAKANFKHNNLDPDRYEFYAADSLFFLNSCKKRNRKFDLIILDPPSFGRSKEGTFQIQRDLPKLLKASQECLSPGGQILATTNFEELDMKSLEALIKEVFSKCALAPISVPYDFEFPLEREKVLLGYWITFYDSPEQRS